MAEKERPIQPSTSDPAVETRTALLEGERRNVSIIFGDISGFTAMSESMDPEEVRRIMNRCFDGMVEAVHHYDGKVDKFIGDCIMVLFGAPQAHEDDPERAVRCAIDMLSHLGSCHTNRC